MANVTDPLAAAVHGTDPQNLMEYITRQKIYDSRYWKEECFGLTAVNVLEKATKLTCIGASFGANRQPTKFLCLVLKLLQIHPEESLVDEFLATEDFKYVRALGAFYRRLTSRPADIYQSLEGLYTDYSKLRYRDIHEWKLIYMDEFVHSLLKTDRVCGITLPRLPQRRVLQQEGYLVEERQSALRDVLRDRTAEEYLYQRVQAKSEAAKAVWEARQEEKNKRQDEKERLEAAIRATKEELLRRGRGRFGAEGSHEQMRHRSADRRMIEDNDRGQRYDDEPQRRVRDDDAHGVDRPRGHDDRPRHRQDERGCDREGESSRKRARKDERKYGSLFKSSRRDKESETVMRTQSQDAAPSASSVAPEEGSEEYWNDQRAKLGLKPLKK